MSKDLGPLPPLTPEVLQHRVAQKPAVLLVPGWDDSRHEQYDRISAALEEQGWLMRRVEFPGDRSQDGSRKEMNRDQHLKELVAAYDAWWRSRWSREGPSPSSASAMAAILARS